MAKNVIIKQKKSKTEVVDIYPQTESNIVINNSTEITGNTVTDAFNSALPLTAGKNISINTKDTGVEIAFTGSLKPNVSVTGENNNPVEVTGTPGDTSATYTVKHKTNGFTDQYNSNNTITSISSGTSKIKIPQLTVDTYGHVTAAEDQEISISIPSIGGMVTSSSTLTANAIILGDGNRKVKASSYGISQSSGNTTNKDNTIWTQSAVEDFINNKITEGVQYLGVGTDINSTTGSITGMDAPNSKGDWGRVTQKFTVPTNLSSSGTTEEAHVGDIVICTQINGTNPLYIWDVIHTEVDTDTWRPITDGTHTLSNSSTTLTISGANGITTSLNTGTGVLTLTGTTYSVSQSTNKNQFTFTPSSGSAKIITIDNVANAVNATSATTAAKATQVANALTVQFNDTNQFTYNGSEAKTLNITASNIGAATSSHDHGNITSDGRISSIHDTPITSNSKIVITDDSGKIARSTITFDGTTTTKALTPSGQWKDFLQNNQTITINSGLKHKKLDTDPDSFITGTAHGRTPVLGESGVGAGIYSAIEVNQQGIAIAGAQVIKYYTKDKTNHDIQIDDNLASGGFAFVEI